MGIVQDITLTDMGITHTMLTMRPITITLIMQRTSTMHTMLIRHITVLIMPHITHMDMQRTISTIRS